MNIHLVENSHSIQAIYRDRIPSFENVFLVKCVILPGADTEVILTIDTKELPVNMPEKWVKREVNIVQIELEIIVDKILEFDVGNSNEYTLEIESVKNNHRRIYLREKKNNKTICIEASWIYLKNITGYTQW